MPRPEDENRALPEWARRERRQDMEWIGENFYIFWPLAIATFQVTGRGAIVVNTTLQPVLGLGHPIAYYPQAMIEEMTNEDLKRMVREYNPQGEFVVHLLKPKDRVSTYRIGILQGQDGK